MIYDISPRIDENLAVWPGDVAPSREVLLDLRRGDPVTLSALRATVHLGSHADGPNHYGVDGEAIGRRPLDFYLGPCRLVSSRVGRAGLVQRNHLPATIGESRLLIRTDTYPGPDAFLRGFRRARPGLRRGAGL